MPRRALSPCDAAALAALSALAFASPAWAQYAVCDSCEGCTAAAAVAGASVEIGTDLVASGEGPCVVVRGEGVRLDGLEHQIRAAPSASPVAVRVEAARVVVRNIHTKGVAVGVDIAGGSGARAATVYHASIEATAAGVRVASAEGARIVRSSVKGALVGVSFGASASGACQPASGVKSPGAVLVHSHVEGGKVGVAACDAIPLLIGNTITRNDVGLLLGARASADPGAPEGARGPSDPCLCAPELEGVKPGTTLLYSSGCGGCLEHEAFLPDVRAKGRDVLLRPTAGGPEASRAFDAYVDRCAPEVTDALGVPGCVPNYACVAADRVAKVRSGDRSVAIEDPIDAAADVARFSEACEQAASRLLRPGSASCAGLELVDNVICANKAADVRAAGSRFSGSGDACGKAEGFSDEGREAGCEKPCPGSIAPAAVPQPRPTKEKTALPRPSPPRPSSSPPPIASAGAQASAFAPSASASAGARGEASEGGEPGERADRGARWPYALGGLAAALLAAKALAGRAAKGRGKGKGKGKEGAR